MLINPEIEKRFWSRVNQTKNCWNWNGFAPHGYGRFRVGSKIYETHRLSFLLTVGKIPEDMCVLHKCDNRSCVRPSHLFLGTIADNNKDRDLKLRHRPLCGSKNGFAKLTEKNVHEIRRAYVNGKTQIWIGQKYKISQGHITRIVNRKAWRHI